MYVVVVSTKGERDHQAASEAMTTSREIAQWFAGHTQDAGLRYEIMTVEQAKAFGIK